MPSQLTVQFDQIEQSIERVFLRDFHKGEMNRGTSQIQGLYLLVTAYHILQWENLLLFSSIRVTAVIQGGSLRILLTNQEAPTPDQSDQLTGQPLWLGPDMVSSLTWLEALTSVAPNIGPSQQPHNSLSQKGAHPRR